jgi:hypothetical protein
MDTFYLKKDATISGYDSQSSLRHVYGLGCGKIVTCYSDLSLKVNGLIDKRLIVVSMLVTIFIGIVTVIKLRANSFDQQGTISEQQAFNLAGNSLMA